MTTQKKLFGKIKKSTAFMVAVLFVLSLNILCSLGLVLRANNVIFASSETPQSVTISNPSFSSYTGTSPRTPTSWTKIETDSGVVAGVVDIDDAKKDSFSLTTTIKEYEGMSEDYVLLMNSPVNSAKMGYRSSEFTLEKNSHYVVSFKAYVQNGAFASAYLSGEDYKNVDGSNFTIVTPYEYEEDVKDGDGNVTGTQTVKSANWRTCYFLISTNEYFDTKVNLDLRLGNTLQGATGAVLFDEVKVNKYVEGDFATLKNVIKSTSEAISSEIDARINSAPIFSENFEDVNLTNWEKVKDCDADLSTTHNGHTFLGSSLDESVTKITTNISNQGLINNNGALYINNTESLSVGYKLKNNLTIEKNKLYLLSFDALTSSISGDGSAKVKLFAKNNDNEFEEVQLLEKISTSNAWKKYGILINSNDFNNTDVYVEFWVENAKGYALFDNLKLEEITYKNYSKYLEENDDTCVEADVSFTNAGALNGYFSKTYIGENSLTNAQKWTHETFNDSNEIDDTLQVKYGVVNTGDFSNVNFAVNPGDPNYSNHPQTNNNILVMHNASKAKQTFTSNTTTISANKNYVVKVSVATQNGAKAGVKILDNENNVLYEVLNIETIDGWETYTINIVGASEDKTVKFCLSIGEGDFESGTVFFDNLTIEEAVSTTTGTSYSDLFNNTSTNVLNLSKNDFANVDTLSKTNGIYDARNWEYTKKASVNAGVVDTNKFYEVKEVLASLKNPNTPEALNNANSKVFMIDSAFETYYSITNKKQVVLDIDKYYKISFWVYTDSIPASQEDDEYKHGASIKILDSAARLGESFTGINTHGAWEEYTLYINTLASTSSLTNYNLSLVLSLGSENLQTSGTVYFSEIVTTTIEQAEFDNIVKEQESDVNDKVITFVGSKIEDTNADDTETEDTKTKGEFSFLYFSTILTAVVTILAVVAFALRSLKIKRPVRFKAEDLNKERLSARNFAFKDKMIEINNRLAVLDDELFETNKKIDDLLYENKSEGINELKAQREEITQKMKDVKQEEKELVEQYKRFKKDLHRKSNKK